MTHRKHSNTVAHLLPLVSLILIALTATPASAQSSTPWWERIDFGGDFRARYESFYEDAKTPRHRVRMRLRLRLDTDINDDTHFELQVASGDPGTPVSTNQTFTNFLLPKPFNLDRAALTYRPPVAPALTLGAGKFTFPVTRTQMTWDDDVNWEGGFQQVAWDLSPHAAVKIVAIETALNEVKAGEDAFMVGAYGEFSFTLGRYAFQISGANYGFGRVDQIAVATSTGPLESINTNRLALGPAGEVIGFASDFNLVDVIGEVSIDTGRAEYPVRLLADWVRNTGATTDRDSGVWLEVGYGRGRSAGTFSTGYTFGHVEEDAVLSPFVFSDMPGSNLTLHMVEASYVLAPGLSIDFTLHVTKRLLVPTDSANPFRVRPHLAAVARF